jgi:cysteine desulfurase / selenocysteine lyase
MIVSVLCHEAGITGWISLAKSLGIAIKWWAPPRPSDGSIDTNPQLDIEQLRLLLTPKTRLVCCGHINNIIGTIHPIRKIADLVHTIPGALICVDGVAWAPHRAIDVKALDADIYVFSWYKVFGPHFAQIYAKRVVQQRYLTSLNHYHLDPTELDTKLRIGTNCYELEDCLVPLVRYLKGIGWDNITKYEAMIVKPLLEYLTANPQLYTLYGERTADAEKRVSCVSFIVNGVSSGDIATELHNTSNVRIIAGDCYSLRPVYDLLGVKEPGVLRCSLVHYNTLEEVEIFIEVLDRVARSQTKKLLNKA